MRDTRLRRESVEGLPVGDRLWRLMEPAWDHEAKAGTHGQQVIALTTFFIRDIGNGGLDQALYNFGPSAVEFILKSFDELGAAEHSTVVRAGLHALFGLSPPGTQEERRRIIDARSRAWLDEHIDPLSDRLYGEEKLEAFYLRYIDAHVSEFFQD
ncbi:DMP19 family protein [Corallococcus terminator]